MAFQIGDKVSVTCRRASVDFNAHTGIIRSRIEANGKVDYGIEFDTLRNERFHDLDGMLDNLHGYYIDPHAITLIEYAEPSAYKFKGAFKDHGASLSNILRKNPCHFAVQVYLDYCNKFGTSVSKQYTDINEFLALPVVQDNLEWLISNNVLEADDTVLYPWSVSKLPKNRSGDLYVELEREWIKKKVIALLTELTEETGRTYNGIATHVQKCYYYKYY